MPYSPASGRHVLRLQVYNTASVAIQAVTATTAAFNTSKGIKCHPFQKVGVWFDISATGGTGETLDVVFEVSEDSTNGVDGTWAAMRRGTTASQTQAAVNQVTTVTGASQSPMFDIPCSDHGYVRVKLNMTSGDSYDVDNMYWILRA